MSDRPKFLDHVNSYEFTCELPGSGETVAFKPVSTGQIKKLLTFENETNYVVQEQALDDLLSSSVLSEGFDVGDLYIYDRLFLLLELRKKTEAALGSKFNIKDFHRVLLSKGSLPLEILEREVDKYIKSMDL